MTTTLSAGHSSINDKHLIGKATAATEITTRLFEQAVDTDRLGCAEALHRSMLALMKTADKPYYAHPLFWAPFVVVGEGAL